MSELDGPQTPPVTFIPAGQRPPGAVGEISIADSIIPAVKQAAAAYIVNQAEGTVSYYMEGMGAPMGSFRNYGHETRAIEIVDRSMCEDAPGVYQGRVKIPVEGYYDVAFMMDSPQFLHCFTAVVEPDPNRGRGRTGRWTWSTRWPTATCASAKQVDPVHAQGCSSRHLGTDLADVSVLYYRPMAAVARSCRRKPSATESMRRP